MAERDPIQDVNIGLGDDISRILYEASKQTQGNRPGFLVEFHESFSGFRAIPLSVLKDMGNLYMNLGFDGVGTKVEIAERIDDHTGVAFDLFAMVCDDAVVRGAEPVALGSILDVRNLNNDQHTLGAINQLAHGYVEAANEANVVVVNGETAELGDRVNGYGEFNYNWGAGVLWIAHKKRVLTGKELRAGDSLVGLAEKGFRSNGITDVRKTMLDHYGPDWHLHTVRDLGELTLGRLAQIPSTIYARVINELNGGYDIDKDPKAKISGVAHITGGGLPSKLGRMLEPSGLGATLDNNFRPPEIMLHVQRLSGRPDREAYGRWHMGSGMIIATPEPDLVVREAQTLGVEARVVGEITDEPGIRIKNKGAIQDEEWLAF